MAAVDTFQHCMASLSAQAQKHLAVVIRGCNEDLLAARSEDARNRIVEEFTREVRRFLTQKK